MPPEADGAWAPRWNARGAWAAGGLLFVLEAAQTVALLPLLLRWLPLADVTLWTSLTAGLGLVNAAAAAYAQPLVRAVSARAVPALPGDWRALCRRADRTGAALLLALQVLLAAVLAWQLPGWPAAALAAVVLYFVAMQLRLLALTRFVWLNGLGQVGRDKRLLVRASAVTLVAAVALASATGSVVGLALATLLGAALLARHAGTAASGASRSGASSGHNSADASVAWPARREMAGLVLLHLSGYLNLGTDVLLANQLLPADRAVAYAFWSRALMSTCLLAGLYTQIRFPTWARADAAALRAELRRGIIVAAWLLPLVLAIDAAAGAWLPGASAWRLPWPLLAALAATATLVNIVLMTGQMNTARGAWGFLLPSAAVACTAPLLALAAAQAIDAGAFAVGYTVANALLCVINVAHARRTLRASPA